MDITLGKKLMLGIGTMLTLVLPVQAENTEWQVRRLLQPTPEEERRDASGRIFIYDGLHEAQVNQAMDSQFHRVDSMMFVRTRVDTADGETEVEDDGCDE